MLSMKPKVLIIYASSSLSGPGKGLLQFIRHASALNYVLASFIPAVGVDTEFTEVAKSRGANYIPIIQKGMLDFSLIRQVREICDTNDINIIQTHGYKGHIIAFFLSKMLGVKWVAWAHGWTNENAKIRLYNKIERFCLKRADIAIAVSPDLNEVISGFRGKQRKTHMILNAVDEGELLSDVGGSAIRQNYDIRQQDIVIGCFGRFSPEKGQEVLVESVARIVPECPEIKVMLVGSGQERDNIEALVDRLGISDHIIFCGYQRAMQDFYEAVDIVVLPSHSEGLPNVALEGMMHKRAVISTDVGGVREIIHNGENGWIVPPGDRLAMAKILKIVVTDVKLRDLVSERGYQSLHPKFSPEKRAQNILSVYNDLLNEK